MSSYLLDTALAVFAVQKVTHCFFALLVQFFVAVSLCAILRLGYAWYGFLLATRRATIGKTRFVGS